MKIDSDNLIIYIISGSSQAIVHRLGAGALSVAIYTGLAAWLVRRHRLARNGRHGLGG